MYKTKSKVSETIVRVSSLLLKLVEKPMSYEEIFEHFENKLSSQVYTREAIKKYFDTLRALGLEIYREKGKYSLLNFLVQIKLNPDEIKAFNYIETSVLKYGTTNDIGNFINLKRKLLKFLDKDSQTNICYRKSGFFTTKIGLKIKEFQQLCEEGQRIKIDYKNKEMIVEPRNICFINNKVYLECLNCNTSIVRRLVLEKVELINRQPQMNRNNQFPNAVIFELSGKLAKNYKLKEGESVLAENPNKLFVKNTSEDYEFLAQRLIRYKNSCKIIKPDNFRKYFVKYTNEILKMYEN